MEEIDEELASLCEQDFQSGAGRAQIRNSINLVLMSSCDSLKQAQLRCNYEWDEFVLWRSKVRGEQRYKWVLA